MVAVRCNEHLLRISPQPMLKAHARAFPVPRASFDPNYLTETSLHHDCLLTGLHPSPSNYQAPTALTVNCVLAQALGLVLSF